MAVRARVVEKQPELDRADQQRVTRTGPAKPRRGIGVLRLMASCGAADAGRARGSRGFRKGGRSRRDRPCACRSSDTQTDGNIALVLKDLLGGDLVLGEVHVAGERTGVHW
jgi:hypothetical protein